jgi:hypothetical protein
MKCVLTRESYEQEAKEKTMNIKLQPLARRSYSNGEQCTGERT